MSMISSHLKSATELWAKQNNLQSHEYSIKAIHGNDQIWGPNGARISITLEFLHSIVRKLGIEQQRTYISAIQNIGYEKEELTWISIQCATVDLILAALYAIEQ